MLQKINYQKELDRFITDLQKEEKSPDASASQLLRPMQQLCAGILKQLLQNHGTLLQPEHLPGE